MLTGNSEPYCTFVGSFKQENGITQENNISNRRKASQEKYLLYIFVAQPREEKERWVVFQLPVGRHTRLLPNLSEIVHFGKFISIHSFFTHICFEYECGVT